MCRNFTLLPLAGDDDSGAHLASGEAPGVTPSVVEGTVSVPRGAQQDAYRAALASEDHTWEDVERRVVSGGQQAMAPCVRVQWFPRSTATVPVHCATVWAE